MGPRLDDPPVIDEDDPVGVANRLESVGHHDHRTLGGEVGQRLSQKPLARRIEGRGGLVEQDDRRWLGDGPGDGDALPLATGQAAPVLAELGVVAVRERFDAIVYAGGSGGPLDRGAIDCGVSGRDGLSYRACRTPTSCITAVTSIAESARRMASTSTPSIVIEPDSTGIRPATARRTVDLPAPDGPTIAVTERADASRSIPRSTGTPGS